MFLSVFFFRNSLQFKKVSLPLQPQTRNNGAIAQLVEQRTENPCVPGSIPGGTTQKADFLTRVSFFCFSSSKVLKRFLTLLLLVFFGSCNNSAPLSHK